MKAVRLKNLPVMESRAQRLLRRVPWHDLSLFAACAVLWLLFFRFAENVGVCFGNASQRVYCRGDRVWRRGCLGLGHSSLQAYRSLMRRTNGLEKTFGI